MLHRAHIFMHPSVGRVWEAGSQTWGSSQGHARSAARLGGETQTASWTTPNQILQSIGATEWSECHL